MVMKKFDIQDRIILDDALDSFLIAAKVHAEEADLLGNRPIVTYQYWEMMMKVVVMGASIITEMGGGGPRIIKDLRKGLDWFRTHSPEAYMVLLD